MLSVIKWLLISPWLLLLVQYLICYLRGYTSLQIFHLTLLPLVIVEWKILDSDPIQGSPILLGWGWWGDLEFLGLSLHSISYTSNPDQY